MEEFRSPSKDIIECIKMCGPLRKDEMKPGIEGGGCRIV